MKVILLQDIPGTGKKGDMKDVSEGYVRNFLIPHKLVKPATSGAVVELQSIAAKKAREAERAHDALVQAGKKLSGQTLSLSGKVNAEGTLYAAITPKVVAVGIAEELGTTVTSDQVALGDAIKKPGTYTVNVKFGNGVTAQLRLVVTAEK